MRKLLACLGGVVAIALAGNVASSAAIPFYAGCYNNDSNSPCYWVAAPNGQSPNPLIMQGRRKYEFQPVEPGVVPGRLLWLLRQAPRYLYVRPGLLHSRRDRWTAR